MLMTEIKRESVGVVNFDEITLGVGAEAAELLGYEVLQSRQVEVTEATPILKVLSELEIEVLSQRDVKQYKHEHQREIAQKTFADWMALPTSDWNSTRYTAPAWRELPIKEYKEAVPEFVLQKAIQIKKAVPGCVIAIEHLEESPDPFLIVHTDMGSSYKTPTETYYVEVLERAQVRRSYPVMNTGVRMATHEEDMFMDKCRHCEFTYRQHGRYSEICPVLIKGMLHQFQSVEEKVNA